MNKSPNTNLDSSGKTSENLSASARKIKPITNSESGISTESEEDIPPTGFRLVDMDILSCVIAELPCPDCIINSLTLTESNGKKGFSSELSLQCSGLCGYKRDFHTSAMCGKGYEVNRRMVYSMRQCGVGFSGLSKWSTYMNMPPPMCKTSYNKINSILASAAKSIALNSMCDAAKEICKDGREEVVDIGVSVDASWQRRGSSSLNGVTTAISIETGKILDTHPQTKHCQKCTLKESLRKSDPKAYEVWKQDHSCSMNHVGSSGAMECEGAKTIFQRSLSKHGLRYTEFYGDGDSKSHPTVQDVYPGLKVKKRECIGHVQKRVENRLRNL